MKETDALDEYILQHIDEETDYLKALYRDTHVKLLRPRMASGHLQGRMLKMFVRMIRPKQVLEIKKEKVTLKDPAGCILCGMCELRCPDYAIYLVNQEE